MVNYIADRYDFVTRFLHLIMALMMISLLAMGFYMAGLAPSFQFKWTLYGIHKAIGVLVFVLVLLRLVWRATHPAPLPVPTQNAFEIRLAKIMHIFLYVAMIVMPVSGYIMSAAGGHPVSFFGLFNVPLLIPENKGLGGIARDLHEVAGFVIALAIFVHVLAAFKHHFIDRDGTLSRMFGCCARCPVS